MGHLIADYNSPDPEISAPRPLTAPRKPLTVGPYAVVATLMTVIVLLFAAYIGAQLFRFAKPPVVAVTQPTAAVTTAPADATSYTLVYGSDQGGGAVDPDHDADGDVDLGDFGTFQLCFGGSNNPPAPTCPPGVDADCDGDGDVDLADFIIFQQNFTGSL